MGRSSIPKIAIMWRGDSAVSNIPEDSRLRPIARALEHRDLAVLPLAYSEEMSSSVHAQLLDCDGALVWVDPLTNGRTRKGLDALLRDVSAHGVWVGSHPDSILKMGTKEVLYRTRALGWGGDTALYESTTAFRSEFPERLRASGVRVLKQYRGNGGQGVWKVMLQTQDRVRLQEATNRDGRGEVMSLDGFLKRCEIYFAGEGRLIDQAFQPRIVEGMVRCYHCGSRLVGFARQYPQGYGEGITAEETFGLPSAKTMLPSDTPLFQDLRRSLEHDWIPKLREIAGLTEEQMPALWDADFLFGPMTADGRDSFVLCEINASCVTPFPPEAPAAIAERVKDVMKSGNRFRQPQ